MFESFSLSTSIAGDCEIQTNTPAAMQCAYQVGPFNVFISSIAACERDTDDTNGLYNGICYHVPFETNTLFNS